MTAGLVGLILGGWFAAAQAGCPDASPSGLVDAFEAMVSDPSTATMLTYAGCLAEFGLVHAAQRHYLEVARSGPEPAAWRAGLEGAMSLVDVTGDPLSVQAYLRGVDVRVFGGEGRGPWYDAMLFVNGQQLAGDGQHELAAVRLDDIDPRSPWAAPARLAQARALDQAGRTEQALERYVMVPDGPYRSEALARSALLLARTDRVEPALAVLAELETDPARAGFAVPLRARMLLRQNRLADARAEAARGLRVARTSYAPDAELVVAEVALADCRVGVAQRALDRFDRAWPPVAVALDTAANVGNADGLRVWTAWLGPEPVRWGLPEPVRAEALNPQPARAWVESHLELIDLEQEAVHAVDDARFQAIVRPNLDELHDDGRDQLRRLLGQEVQRRMQELHAGLQLQQRAAVSLRERLEACRGASDTSVAEDAPLARWPEPDRVGYSGSRR